MANPGRIKCSSKVHKTPVLPTRHQHIPGVVVKRKVGEGDSSFLDEKPHQPAQGYQTPTFSLTSSKLHVISTAVLDDCWSLLEALSRSVFLGDINADSSIGVYLCS
ncbi:hypothetical protein NPIL_34111 [Nephila pilipes]|uniref:Uncharacterized protein n=1 Tax=Nephila pilipes TaxID=299642 RepID=A0A8X6TVH6_NEPPI|nr:hypothetical protein NPIL_34111 [Nephila pilipes]